MHGMNGGFVSESQQGAILHLSPSTYEAENNALYQRMRYLTVSHSWAGLIKERKRVLSAGDLGAQNECSSINPGVLHFDGKFRMLCRGEPDETVWFGDFLVHQANPLWCVFNNNLNLVDGFLLSHPDLPPNSRSEDWRLFEYEGNLYTNHSIYTLVDREQWIVRSRPAISEINLKTRSIKLRWILDPPFEAASEEKNWSFFVHDGSLMCIYSFQPYVLLKIDLEQGKTEKVLEVDLNYQWYDKGKFVGNSTNLVSWDSDRYILFVHDFLEPKHEQRNRAYMQYGVLIDKKTLLPTNVIPQPLIMGGDEIGRHPGVHYTSALVNRNDGLYAFFGEGDTHTGIVIFNKEPLNDLFDKHPVDRRKHTTNCLLGVEKGIDPRKGIVISFPRNGLNWLRYCIESLTGLRTPGRTKLVQNGELAIYRTHDVQYADDPESCYCALWDREGKPLHNKVLLILRDYRETFLRMAKTKQDPIPTAQEIKDGCIFHFRDYFENLKAYDEFKGEKLLVYYPDLVSNFSEILKILDFFELPYDLADFDVEYHRQQSLEIYDSQHKSYTKDDLYDFTFHQRGVDREIIEAIDEFVDANYKDLADAYLR